MKTFFAALIICFTIAAKAQTPALQKLWVGDNKVYLKAYNDSAICFQSLVTHIIKLKDREIAAIGNDHSGLYQLSGNKLHLSKGWFSEPGGYDFLIDMTAKDKLMLTPVNPMAKGFMEFMMGSKQEKYVFKEIHQMATNTIRAEKLIYKIKGGYPSVRTTVYELSMDGQFKMFKAKQVYRGGYVPAVVGPNDSDEYFTATVPKALMKQLTDILKISEIDKLPEKGNQNIDITDHTIEVYYNHKVKHIIAGWMPLVAEPLNDFLLNLPQKIDLTPSAKQFDIVLAQAD